MRNQISGSISLDVSSLAEDIASAVAARFEVPAEDAASALIRADAAGVFASSHTVLALLERLRRDGYVLARACTSGTAGATPDAWFGRSAD